MRKILIFLLFLFLAMPAQAQSESEQLSAPADALLAPGDGGGSSATNETAGTSDNEATLQVAPVKEDTAQEEELAPVYAVPKNQDEEELLRLEEEKKDTKEDELANVLSTIERLPQKVQKEITEEGAQSQEYCQSNYVLGNLYDCSCYAIKTMGSRVNRGPDQQWANLMAETDVSSCVFKPAVAGFTYKKCHDLIYLDKITDKQLDETCKCASRTMARDYSRRPGTDIDYVNRMFMRIMADCQQAIIGYPR